MIATLRTTSSNDTLIIKKIEKIAQKTKRSKSAVITEALCEYLEDVELAEKAEKAYNEFMASDQKTYGLEDLKTAVL